MTGWQIRKAFYKFRSLYHYVLCCRFPLEMGQFLQLLASLFAHFALAEMTIKSMELESFISQTIFTFKSIDFCRTYFFFLYLIITRKMTVLMSSSPTIMSDGMTISNRVSVSTIVLDYTITRTRFWNCKTTS